MNGDAELLRRYIEERSEAAFTELVGRHLNLVYFAALRQVGGDAHRAEEVAQTVFTDLARKAASLSRRPVLASWLHTSTRFAAAKAQRAEWRRNKYEQETENMPDFLPDATSTAEWERLRPMIDGVIHELNETDREAVLQRFFEGRSFADIGAALNLSEDAARMRVDRALDKLHLLLSRRGITSTGAALATALANQAVATAPAGLAASIAGSALSGAAAAGAGSLTTLLYFMSGSKIIVSVAVVGAIAITAALYQTNQARAAAVTLADAGRDHAALVARLSDLETGVKAAEKETADREAALTRQRAAKTTASAASEPSPAALAALAQNAKYEEAWAKLSGNDPELLKARMARGRVSYMAEYRPLFQSLGFTPEQIEQACDFLVEERVRQRQADGAAAGKTKEIPAANFWERFGPDVTERVAQFQKTRAARNFVNDLSARTYFVDEPFTAQQAEQLVPIIDNARPAGTLEKSRPAEDFSTAFRRTLDWDKILAQAGTVLSPTQLQGLRGMAAQARVDAQLAAAANEAAAPKK